MSQKLKVSELKEHPKNSFYFDDMSGDAWSEFKQSIKTSGVIEPIVVTQDKVIVSGHQRVKACKSLGIEEIEAEVKIYENDDEILKQLIETNIRQRGIGCPNPVKFGRCLRELERIYGVQHGGDRKSEEKSNPQNADLKTQGDLASELGISVDALNRYKKLANAIPEIQSLIESGKVTKTVALSIMKQLSEEEQKQLAEMIEGSGKEKVSSREVAFYKNRMETLSKENSDLQGKVKELERRRPEPQTIIQEVEVPVMPDDYEQNKRDIETLKKQADLDKMSYNELMAKYNKKCNEALELQDKITDLQHVTQEGLEHENLSENVFYFCSLANNFVGNVGGLVWLTERIADMPDKERNLFLKAARALSDFANVFTQNMERSNYGKHGTDEPDSAVPLLAD